MLLPGHIIWQPIHPDWTRIKFLASNSKIKTYLSLIKDHLVEVLRREEMVADISSVIGLDGKGGTFFLRRLRRGQNKPEFYNFVKKLV